MRKAETRLWLPTEPPETLARGAEIAAAQTLRGGVERPNQGETATSPEQRGQNSTHPHGPHATLQTATTDQYTEAGWRAPRRPKASTRWKPSSRQSASRSPPAARHAGGDGEDRDVTPGPSEAAVRPEEEAAVSAPSASRLSGLERTPQKTREGSGSTPGRLRERPQPAEHTPNVCTTPGQRLQTPGGRLRQDRAPANRKSGRKETRPAAPQGEGPATQETNRPRAPGEQHSTPRRRCPSAQHKPPPQARAKNAREQGEPQAAPAHRCELRGPIQPSSPKQPSAANSIPSRATGTAVTKSCRTGAIPNGTPYLRRKPVNHRSRGRNKRRPGGTTAEKDANTPLSRRKATHKQTRSTQKRKMRRRASTPTGQRRSQHGHHVHRHLNQSSRHGRIYTPAGWRGDRHTPTKWANTLRGKREASGENPEPPEANHENKAEKPPAARRNGHTKQASHGPTEENHSPGRPPAEGASEEQWHGPMRQGGYHPGDRNAISLGTEPLVGKLRASLLAAVPPPGCEEAGGPKLPAPDAEASGRGYKRNQANDRRPPGTRFPNRGKARRTTMTKRSRGTHRATRRSGAPTQAQQPMPGRTGRKRPTPRGNHGRAEKTAVYNQNAMERPGQPHGKPGYKPEQGRERTRARPRHRSPPLGHQHHPRLGRREARIRRARKAPTHAAGADGSAQQDENTPQGTMRDAIARPTPAMRSRPTAARPCTAARARPTAENSKRAAGTHQPAWSSPTKAAETGTEKPEAVRQCRKRPSALKQAVEANPAADMPTRCAAPPAQKRRGTSDKPCEEEEAPSTEDATPDHTCHHGTGKQNRQRLPNTRGKQPVGPHHHQIPGGRRSRCTTAP
ncbi:serine/arginine repetitive matrix protein 1-like [Corythoichthys intestinalis]|uniref:serine/arginine repetitive matrix protein 1-like n=1 Tax=Corythoichthys intestinalis TaxID=161448 RepID=UPI0025A4E362|nr:serine/arginine repetitive matrix protein 1-like [Corythoichthys intestinalis]